MNIMKALKLIVEIATFKLSVKKIVEFMGSQFGKGAEMKTGEILDNINTNKDGSVDLIELGLYLVKELKK